MRFGNGTLVVGNANKAGAALGIRQRDYQSAISEERAMNDSYTTATDAFFCPICGAPTVRRDRSPNGYNGCENNHTYLSSEALTKEDVTDDKGVRWEIHPTLGLHSRQEGVTP